MGWGYGQYKASPGHLFGKFKTSALLLHWDVNFVALRKAQCSGQWGPRCLRAIGLFLFILLFEKEGSSGRKAVVLSTGSLCQLPAMVRTWPRPNPAARNSTQALYGGDRDLSNTSRQPLSSGVNSSAELESGAGILTQCLNHWAKSLLVGLFSVTVNIPFLFLIATGHFLLFI